MILNRTLRTFLYMFLMIYLNSASFSAPLKVGVAVSGAPISEIVSTANGSYYFGFCIDLMNAICSRIHKDCVYKSITLKNQFELLDKGDIDLLILASPSTELDRELYAVSIPYAVSKIQFITLKNSPIDDLADLKNKKIGVIQETFYNPLMQSTYHKQNQIIAYQSVGDLFTDLAHNKIDAIALNNVIAQGLSINDVYNIKLIGPSIPLGDGYGIIALLSDAPLIENINKAIVDIETDGTYVSIYQKYYKP